MILEAKHVVLEHENGLRLDKWIADLYSDRFSRSEIHKWIVSGWIQGPGKHGQRSGQKIKSGQLYTIAVPAKLPLEIVPVDLNLRVLYEDRFLAVIHKPAGVATHPGPGDTRVALVNGIVYQWKHLMEKDDMRPGVVHRLDKDTEGLMLVGLQSTTRIKLMKLFELRKIQKEYRAWVHGNLPASSGRIELGIKRNPQNRLKMMIHEGGRLGITLYETTNTVVSKNGRKFHHIRLEIETGRTHQIRVQMAHLKSPVVGDVLYSNNSDLHSRYGMLLYASNLAFEHPETGQKLQFRMEAPDRFEDFYQSIGK